MLVTFSESEGYISAVPFIILDAEGYQNYLLSTHDYVTKWIKAINFVFQAGKFLIIPSKEEGIQEVIYFIDHPFSQRDFSQLPVSLPLVRYRLVEWPEQYTYDITLSWINGCYQFDYFRKIKKEYPIFIVPDSEHVARARILANSVYKIRNLINLPASHMGPEQLADTLAELARNTGSSFNLIEKNALREGFPLIYAVGKGSHRAPLMAELNWGDIAHPTVVLIGKGVSFDTGGLNIKNPPNMLNMKKDMGGAALAIGIAQSVIGLDLPIRLKVLIPAAENAVSDTAFRPGDVISSRSDLAIEITNTDAEGRLILADALTYACEASPSLIIDFSTLTGAARTALGAEIGAVFTNRDSEWALLERASDMTKDPLWRMPLWPGYDKRLLSNVADLKNSSGGKGTAITAALFLQNFVKPSISWIHLDIGAWAEESQAGFVSGGVAQSFYAVLQYLENRFAEAVEPDKC